MRVPQPLPFQTPGEEIANSILHGLGVLLASGGLVLLVLRAGGYLGGTRGGTLVRMVYIIFTATMITMFLASTLYHAVQHEKAKRVLRILDHSAIYLLIAGTYTPFCILGLQGVLGWTFLGFEWVLAITGIILYAANLKFIKKAELGVYIMMGWAMVMGWIPLTKTMPRISLALMILGGIFYSMGTLWYSKPQHRGTHVTWHVFVLLGAICHWGAIWFMS